MGSLVIRAGAYAVVGDATYIVGVQSDSISFGPRVEGEQSNSWAYVRDGLTGSRIPRSGDAIARLFVVLTWASLDGVDVKVRNLSVSKETARVEAYWPQGAPEGSHPLHPNLVIVGDRGKGYDCTGEVAVDRLTDVWEWAEIDGPVESTVRPETTPWMGEVYDGEPWRRPKLPREKLMWRAEARWGPWGRIETDPLA